MNCFHHVLLLLGLLVIHRLNGELYPFDNIASFLPKLYGVPLQLNEHFGKCPLTKNVPYFNFDAWFGFWYRLETSRFGSANPPNNCLTTVVKPLHHHPKFLVVDDGVRRDTHTVERNVGIAVINPFIPAAWTTFFPNQTFPANVLAIDYHHSAIIYSCTQNPLRGTYIDGGIILSRLPYLEPHIRSHLRHLLYHQVGHYVHMDIIRQHHCLTHHPIVHSYAKQW